MIVAADGDAARPGPAVRRAPARARPRPAGRPAAAPTAPAAVARRHARRARHAGPAIPAAPTGPAAAGGMIEPVADEAEVWQALVLGLRDYVDKNGFPSVVLGLSGGIDSAVVAAIAVDALGPDRVVGVSLPSQHSSEHSRDDAADLAKRTGLDYRVEPIQPMVDALPGQPVAVRAGRGEPAGPGARRDPDGAVQPGGPPGADHRQQERAGGRLLHPLRRLGRRLQPDQGRPEDAGVAAGEVAQRRRGPARRDRRRSRRTRSASRRAPSCARASSTATRCPTTTCSTRS